MLNSIRPVFASWLVRPRLVGLALVLLPVPTSAAPDGWQLLSQFLYRDAAAAFAADPDAGVERKLGLAAALLNEPPITAGKLQRAEALLQAVIHEGDDIAAWYARYLLARMGQVHRGAPPSEVEAAYREILRGAPGTVAAQLSAAHLAMMLLYQRSDLDVDARLDAAAAVSDHAGNPRLPNLAATYYQQMANAALFYGITDDRVLAWLERAHTIGLSNRLDQSTLSLQVAETARALGRRDLAVVHYRRFLATAATIDQRYHTAELRLRELTEEERP